MYTKINFIQILKHQNQLHSEWKVLDQQASNCYEIDTFQESILLCKSSTTSLLTRYVSITI